MSENRLCGAATALMWSNMLVSHSAISRRGERLVRTPLSAFAGVYAQLGELDVKAPATIQATGRREAPSFLSVPSDSNAEKPLGTDTPVANPTTSHPNYRMISPTKPHATPKTEPCG